MLVTGATGFTGSYVVPMLLEHGFKVRCLLRPASEKKKYRVDEVEWVYGDLDNLSSLIEAMRDVEILVNLASIGFGHAPNIVQGAIRSGIQRAIFISTTAIFTTLNAPSKSTRLSAEKTIKESGLNYTILRPTMIYGSSRDRNMCRLIRYLTRWPAIPILGSGTSFQQPVYAGDVAKAVIDCVSNVRTSNKDYDLPGAKALTYNEVIDIICHLIGRKAFKIHLPVSPVVLTLGGIERLGFRLFIKAEQIKRLKEDKAFVFDQAAQDFGYRPRSFEEGIHLELKEMGLVS